MTVFETCSQPCSYGFYYSVVFPFLHDKSVVLELNVIALNRCQREFNARGMVIFSVTDYVIMYKLFIYIHMYCQRNPGFSVWKSKKRNANQEVRGSIINNCSTRSIHGKQPRAAITFQRIRTQIYDYSTQIYDYSTV